MPADQAEFEDLQVGFVRMVQIAETLPQGLPHTALVRVTPEDADEGSWLELVGGRKILDLMLDPDHYTLELLSGPGGSVLASTEGWYGPTASSATLVLH